MANKERLDTLLVEKQIFESRERAKRMIMAGKILVDEKRIDKAGTLINRDAIIRIIGEDIPFVSRGGLKLQKSIEAFNIELNGLIAADIGASTGGFTDCMLQNGAIKVYAIDVGYGQLAWKLRQDNRVVNMERINIRYVTREMIADELDFASIDVAFISLTLVLPVVYELLGSNGSIVSLIKPQFEAGRDKVGKHGVVKDKQVHLDVVERIMDFAINTGFNVRGLTYSPIKGPEGNIEYLSYFTKDNVSTEIDINEVVNAAHNELNK